MRGRACASSTPVLSSSYDGFGLSGACVQRFQHWCRRTLLESIQRVLIKDPLREDAFLGHSGCGSLVVGCRGFRQASAMAVLGPGLGPITSV